MRVRETLKSIGGDLQEAVTMDVVTGSDVSTVDISQPGATGAAAYRLFKIFVTRLQRLRAYLNALTMNTTDPDLRIRRRQKDPYHVSSQRASEVYGSLPSQDAARAKKLFGKTEESTFRDLVTGSKVCIKDVGDNRFSGKTGIIEGVNIADKLPIVVGLHHPVDGISCIKVAPYEIVVYESAVIKPKPKRVVKEHSIFDVIARFIPENP